MAQNSLFEFVKGFLGGGGPTPPPPRRRPAGSGIRYEPPPARPGDPDGHNPATVVRIGKSTDGRELIMTLGLGIFLVDRETPTICYYQQGAVANVPTAELGYLIDCLMDKRNTAEFAVQYVDLLNVAMFEIETRSKRRNASGGRPPAPPPKPTPPPRKAVAKPVVQARWPDAENPATITRVGRSNNGAELIMTLGCGTFVLHREKPDLKYFDRGREWDIQDADLRLLIEALTVKQEMREFQYAYVDLLNVASFLQDRRKNRRR